MMSYLSMAGTIAGGKMLAIAGAFAIASVSVGYVTHSIASGSAAKVELEIQAEAREIEQERHETRVVLLGRERTIDQEALLKIQAERDHMRSQLEMVQDRIEALRAETSSPTGGGGMCPVDCIFPDGLWLPPEK